MNILTSVKKPIIVYVKQSATAGQPVKWNYTIGGFSWGAFILGPLWLLTQGMWLLWIVVSLFWIGLGLLGPDGQVDPMLAMTSMLFAIIGLLELVLEFMIAGSLPEETIVDLLISTAFILTASVAFGAVGWKIKHFSLMFRGYRVNPEATQAEKLLAIESAFGRWRPRSKAN